MTGMGSLGYKYNGALDALQSIVRNEGVRGLYRGLWPNLREFDFLPSFPWLVPPEGWGSGGGNCKFA